MLNLGGTKDQGMKRTTSYKDGFPKEDFRSSALADKQGELVQRSPQTGLININLEIPDTVSDMHLNSEIDEADIEERLQEKVRQAKAELKQKQDEYQ